MTRPTFPLFTRALMTGVFLMTLGLSLAQAQTGCLVSDACNYDAVATVSDNTCYFIGSACNDGDASTINDVRITCNTCLGTAVVFGCMDNSACNYSLLANVSENCKYENDFCDDNNGATIFDKLDDVCVCLGVAAVAGCMDPTMCNYNETANVPGPCIAAPYTANGTECWVCSQTIDAIADPSTPHGNGQGVLLDNDINDNGQCDDTEIIGCMDSTACNYNPNATTLNVFAANGSPCEFALVGCEYCGVLDQNGVPFRYSSVNLNSDSEAVISVGDSLDITTFDAFGQPEQGVSTHPLYVVINNDDDDDSVCNQDEVQGCTLATACNYDSNATNENGSCVFPGECDCVTTGGVQFSVPSASSSPSALAKDIPDGDCDCNGSTLDALDVCGGTCLLDADSNGVCDALEVLGCMDETACNYNEALGVNVDDNTCVLPGTCGCNDDAALDLPITDCDCGGEKLDALEECLLESDPSWCVADTNNNDLCDASEIPGCTNLSACNYNAGLEATFDDGTCVYADTNENGLCDDSEISGCTDSSACNYDEVLGVTFDDGTCQELDECGVCGGGGIPVGDCDCDQNILDQCEVCNGTCTDDANDNNLDDNSEIQGCTDPTSCTWNSEATFSIPEQCEFLDKCNICGGGTLVLPDGDCDCNGNTVDALGRCGGGCIADVDQDGICDSNDPCLVEGEVEDECGVCGGLGAIYACGCEVLSPDACNCDVLTGVQNYPTPGQNCDGTCIYGEDENGVCIFDSEAILTVQPAVTVRSMAGSNSLIVEQDPFKLEAWMANIDSLHSRMSRNLDDGSLLGSSDSLTIENQIVSNGTLKVSGDSDLGFLHVTKDSVVVKTNLYVQGYARIMGTTFSDGGVSTTTIDMSGDMSIGGNLDVTGRVTLDSTVMIMDTLSVHDAIQVGLSNQIFMDSTGYMAVDNLFVREDLEVVQNTTLHGSLDVEEDFKVNQVKFTINHLTGNVKSQGGLIVAGGTSLGNSLQVADNFTVRNNSIDRFKVDATNGNTTLSGTLTANGQTTLKTGLQVYGTSLLMGATTVNGVLDAKSNTFVRGFLNVAGDHTVQDHTVLKKTVIAMGNTTLKSRLNVDGKTTLKGGLSLAGTASLGGNLTVTGGTTLSSSLSVTGLTTLGGGLNMAGANEASLGGNLTVWGADFTHNGMGTFHSSAGTFLVGVSADLVVPTGDTPAASTYAMVVDGLNNDNPNGILIRSSQAVSSNDLNFVTFLNAGSEVVGRIEGETLDEIANDRGYMADHVAAAMDVTNATVNIAAAFVLVTANATGLAMKVAGAIAVCIPGAGLTDVDVAEGVVEVADGVKLGLNTATGAATIAARAVDLAQASINLALVRSSKMQELGVTYESASGDYAEWIEKMDHRSDFLPGEVVGIRAGLISYNTHTSDHNLIISTRPIVLGNMASADESHFEKVAFLGQVPVRIQGVVNQGDFILPSGEDNGYAVAIPRDEIRFDQIPDIVGVAWESGSDPYLNIVNCSVGLDRQGTRQLVSLVEREFEDIRESISGQIALSLTENGFDAQQPGKRWMKRRDKRASKKPLMTQKPESPVAVKPMPEFIVSSGADNTMAAPSTSLSDEDLEQMIQANIQEIMDEYLALEPVITEEDWAEASQIIELEFENALASVPSAIHDGLDRPDIGQLFGYSQTTNRVMELQTELTVAILDAYYTPSRMEPLMRNALRDASKGEYSTDLVKAYPPGSEAEKGLINATIDLVFDEVNKSMPYGRKYTSQRQ